MALENAPETASVVDSRMKTDVARELTGSNPFLRNHWLGAIVTATANRIFDFFGQQAISALESIPDTAVKKLEQWAAIWSVNRLAAAKASGSLAATGTGTIPIGTVWVASDGLEYTSQAEVILPAGGSVTVTLTHSAGVITATTASAHGFASNVKVTISGAVETEYNTSVPTAITVTSATTFTYSPEGANPASSPATGTISAAHDTLPVAVVSTLFGAAQNQSFDAVLSLQTPISGIANTAGVDFTGIINGTDQETKPNHRLRYLDRLQNPVAHFNIAAIKAKAKEISGVTRVFVQEITPVIGQVTIYFMRDDDASAIPDAGEVTTVKNKILEIKPANTRDVDVIVSAPTPVATAFTFLGLTPNTKAMQTAVAASLAQFFDETPEIGVNVDQDAYRSAIFNSVDAATGARVTTFTLSAPVADIVIAAGEIGTLGTITPAP